nr:mynd-type zinc finger protein samb [Quercus suber]
MREVNFSIPNANKASVGITTALYDRRALDCTSTLPLINSLNNLAYLTTSSGRIRDILTVDGGIERLVCILKEGRSKDMMEMWKWNLAFQCIVNIGVRGSETVRTRVVEADMVPVIATILDNYFQVIEKCRERAELESKKKCLLGGVSKGFGRWSNRAEAFDSRTARSRRNAPPPIEIPAAMGDADQDEHNSQITPTGPAASLSLSSPPERTSFTRQHLHSRSQGQRAQFTPPALGGSRTAALEPPFVGVPSQNVSPSTFGLRPVRDADRLPSMVSTSHLDLSSQPQSPTTPGALGSQAETPQASGSRPRRRPSIRHQLSISGSDDDNQVDEGVTDGSTVARTQTEVVVGIQTDIVMQDIVDDESLLEPENGVAMTVPDVSSTDDETFNITHRSLDGSTGNNTTPTQGQLPFPQTQMPLPVNAVNATPPSMQQLLPSRGLVLDRPASILAAMPRDEDVLMSLQLLAYVSKYCNLRTYFQKSHLVPRLRIGNDLRLLDPDYDSKKETGPTEQDLEDEWDNEFVVKPDEKAFNIFPLIEKFTAKPSSSRNATPSSPQQGDMQYWAGVVMRNLCRKDDSRGGIRQCAYWQCGKWEEYTRQFAKCRRCRRTKYCSKECQKGAWGSHRFWCVAAEDGSHGEGSSGDRHHRRHGQHGHHHHHH